MSVILAFVGLAILVFAGDALVRGAVNVSLRLGIPALIVSLTIVAAGTSAPEMLISISAVLGGAPGIAIGNVVGSNTANVLLVLGLPALLVGLNVAEIDTRENFVQMLIGTMVFVVVAFLTPINWHHGVVLCGVYLAFMLYSIHKCLAQIRGEKALPGEPMPGDIEVGEPEMPWSRIMMYLVVGLVGLPLGAEILVTNATIIARHFGVSDTVIGLTLVAIGTSLPELATTISAAFRRQADVALGNVIGSNLANLLAIVGVAAFFGDIPVDPEILNFDLWVMVASSLLLVPFVFLKVNISRIWGFAFVTLYLLYVGVVLV